MLFPPRPSYSSHATSTPPSAGELFESGKGALGAPNYAARIPESSVLSSAGATRLFDIFMRAAPEIIETGYTTPDAVLLASRLSAVRAAGADDIVVADGPSCRHQIRDLTGREAVHSVIVLDRALR